MAVTRTLAVNRPWARVVVALGAVLLTAAVLRLPSLQQVPHLTDETGEVLWAYDIAFHGLRPLTHTDAYNGPLWPYLLALVLRTVGSSAALPRWFALVLGLATIAATFALGWRLARREVRLGAATVAGLVMATAFTHAVVNSRVAWSNSSTPLWTTATVLALLAAIRRGNGPLMVAAGFLGGLALHTHPSVSVFLGGLALWFLLDRGRRRWLRGPWPWLAVLAATVAYSPVIVFNLSHGLATLAEARGSRNFATESGVPWPVGVFGLLAQLGRSLGGGYRLDGPDPAWAAVSWLYTVVAGMALVWLARHPGVAVGRRLPLVVVGVSTLTLPLFNANWHGLLEARYLGYIWPLVAAAVGAVVAEAWSGARRPARVALATATIALIVLPAVRIRQLDAAARTEQVDNLRLWSMLATIEAEPTIAPVRVDENLKATGWRAGGHPRRAMEYLLTLDGVAFDRVRLDEINASLDGGAASWLLLAGPTADALAGRDLVPADVTSRPGEDHWGLYFHGTRPATPPP